MMVICEPRANPDHQARGSCPAAECVDQLHGCFHEGWYPAQEVTLRCGGGVHRRLGTQPPVHRSDVEVLQHEHSPAPRRAARLAVEGGDEVADGAQPPLGGVVAGGGRPVAEGEVPAQVAREAPLELLQALRVPRVPPGRREDHDAGVPRHLDELREAGGHRLADAGRGAREPRVRRALPVPHLPVADVPDLLGDLARTVVAGILLRHLHRLPHVDVAEADRLLRLRVLDAYVEHAVDVDEEQRVDGPVVPRGGAQTVEARYHRIQSLREARHPHASNATPEVL
eukprot:CAMPEP_0179240182 /NCGR_PEP_ID=MMETSP0797-20121207/15844_1 /TAXON_ID=47934 /ORGANISM="Dinophysis acuminata, Strain DAEP01" /LENGTH=283 /DNA_ID=CAMNT_0020947527 /DNA_START=129 /DNA_END=976 /DNA_ORIENTATION=-